MEKTLNKTDFFRQPWLIHPDWLYAMAADNLQALAGQENQPYQPESQYTSLRGNLAVIDITGPIFRYESYYTRYFLATALERLSREFNGAVNDPAVDGILFNINSPGGQADSIGEFSDRVYQAREQKPIWAYTGNMAASAAYWIGSAAERFFVSAESETGSIGAVLAVTDYSKLDERMGIREIKIVSSQTPKKRLDPKTDAGRAALQERADNLADRFIQAVARNRDVSVETVLNDFGQGGVLPGAGAVAVGMADEVGYFEYAVNEFETKIKNIHFVGGISMNEQETPVTVTREGLEADYKDLVESIKAEGFQAGVAAERERIKALEGLGATGHEALIEKCKFDEPVTAEQAAVMVLAAEKKTREAAAADLATDAAEVPDVPANPATDGDSELNQAIAAMVAGGNSVRGK